MASSRPYDQQSRLKRLGFKLVVSIRPTMNSTIILPQRHSLHRSAGSNGLIRRQLLINPPGPAASTIITGVGPPMAITLPSNITHMTGIQLLPPVQPQPNKCDPERGCDSGPSMLVVIVHLPCLILSHVDLYFSIVNCLSSMAYSHIIDGPILCEEAVT